MMAPSPMTTYFNEWSRISIEAAKKIGKTFENAQFTKENMIKAGFVDVIEEKYKMPVRGWSSVSND
jgi:hypothetical protein